MKNAAEVRAILTCTKKGWSDTRIAQELHVSRNTVRKYRSKYWEVRERLNALKDKELTEEVLQTVMREVKKSRRDRKPYKYTEEMDLCLDRLLDEEAGNDGGKRTNRELHSALLEEGFGIGYTTVCKKVGEKRLSKRGISPWCNR